MKTQAECGTVFHPAIWEIMDGTIFLNFKLGRIVEISLELRENNAIILKLFDSAVDENQTNLY